MSSTPQVPAPVLPQSGSLFADSAPPRPFSFCAGQILRKAREKSKLTLDEASQSLCLSKSILEALEEGRYRELSYGETYLIGFVGSYARFLKLDPEQIIQKIREELPPSEKTPELIFPVPLPVVGYPKKSILFFSILITGGFLFFGTKFLVKRADQISSVSLPFVPVQVTLSGDKNTSRLAQNPPKSITVVEKKPSPEAKNASVVAEIPWSQSPPQEKPPFSLSDTAILKKSPDLQELIPLLAQQSQEEGLSKSTISSQETVFSPGSLILEATEKSWIEIRTAEGKYIFSKVMNPGDIHEIQENTSWFLKTGNMGGLRIRQGGQVIESMGKSGEVQKNIPLTFESLKKASER